MLLSSVKRNLIYLISTTDIFGVSLIVPLYTQYLKSINFSNVNIGFINSVYSGVQFFASPIIGHLSDVYGSRFMLIASLLICSLSYPIMGMTVSFAAIAAVRVLIGMIKHTQLLCKNYIEERPDNSVPTVDQNDLHYDSNNFAANSRTDDDEKGKAENVHHFGKLSAFMSLGYIVGPAIGGYLIDEPNGFTCMCFVTGTICAINSWFASCLPTKTRPVAPKSENSSVSFITSFKNIPWTLCWDLFLLKLLTVFAVFSFYLNYNTSVSTRYGVSSIVLGYSISLQGVVRAITGFTSPCIYNLFPATFNTSAKIRVIYLLMMSNLVALYLSPNFYTYLACLVPFNACLSFIRIVNHEVLVERTKIRPNKGIILGAFNNVTAISRSSLPIVSGYLADKYGYDSGYFISIASLLVAIVIISFPKRRPVRTKVE